MLSKKIISILLAFIFVLNTGMTASATKVDPVEPVSGFYILSDAVPEEAIEHTRDNIGSMINDLFPLKNVKIGTPFKLTGSNLYYFIIYCEEEIVGTYRVFERENGSYSGIFNENDEFILGLEKIKELTSLTKPAKIMIGEYEDIFAIIGTEIHTVLKDYAGNVTSPFKLLVQPLNGKSTEVIDAAESIEFKIPKATRATYNFLQIGWAETQGSQKWCSAFVTASILRYRKSKSVSSISAKIIMQYIFPGETAANLEKKALSFDNAIKYAKEKQSITPTKLSSKLSYANLKKEIDADRPVYFACDNVTTGVKTAHAFVCRGYNDNSGNSFYSVWNPWYTKFERMYTSDNSYYTTTGTQYRWSQTIYNWK